MLNAKSPIVAIRGASSTLTTQCWHRSKTHNEAVKIRDERSYKQDRKLGMRG